MTQPVTAYQGGKQRIAPDIVRIIEPKGNFYDLCCGSGAVSIELVNRGYDPSLITMVDQGPWGLFWQMIGNGTFDLDKMEYHCNQVPANRKLIKAYMESLARQPADLDTVYTYLLLQASSFGSKAIWIKNNRWCNTSFRSYWEPTATSNRRSPVNPMMPMPRTLYERVKDIFEVMRGVNGLCCNINEVTPDGIVYIDPPYKGTTAYGYSLDYLSYIKKLKTPCYVSEGFALSPNAYQITSSREKGGISGKRISSNEEWLSAFNVGV